MSVQRIGTLPRRPRTLRRYVRILKFACRRNEKVSAVAKHFGCSEATVINASKAFGLTFEEVRHRRALRRVARIERCIPREDTLSLRDRLMVDLYSAKEAPTLDQIGVKFGLSRQRVHQILAGLRKRGVKLVDRSKPVMGHWVERCEICRQLVETAHRTPLITTRRLGVVLNVRTWTLYWHLQKLRARNLVPRHFGRLRSERLIRAIDLYNRDPNLSAMSLGRLVGYKNLPGAFQDLRRRGYGYLLVPRRDRRSQHRSSVVRIFPTTPGRSSASPRKKALVS